MGFWPFKSNFTLIAENTTKYYLELIRNYSNRFDEMDCLVIVSDHNEFRGYDWQEIGKKLRTKIVVDGRNIVVPERMKRLSYIYKGVGYC